MRRKIRAALLGAAWCGIAAAQQTATATATAPAPMPVPPDVQIETIAIAPGIYMLKGDGGNIGLTVGVDGAAIIDSQFDRMVPKIRAAVALLAERPVKFVVNTHLHGDHTGGNDALGRAGAVIIAHDNVRRRLGSPQVNPSTNEAIAARAREALPVITFADAATLHFNGDELEFTHLPNAHTETDIIVRFSKANIVHMGDTFTGSFPFIDANSGGTLDGLIRGHEKVLSMVDDSTRIIRGHGPLASKAELQAYHDMLAAVRDRVAKLVKAGKTQEQVVDARPTREFEQKYAGTNFNAAQWIGRVYVDQQRALAQRKQR